MEGSFINSFSLHLYSVFLYGGFICILLAVVLMVISIGSGSRSAAIHEFRIYVRLEVENRVKKLGNWYSNDWSDRLLRSMGAPPWLSAARLKILRDVLCIMLAMIIFIRYFFLNETEYYYPLVLIAAIFSALSPNEQFPSIFTTFIAPLFQRIHKYRVSRETGILIQLLRNEVSETQQRNVLSIIRQYQNYFTIFRDDLILLEHEWKNRITALRHFRERYPDNEEIETICSVLEKLDEVGYEEAGNMLQENEKTFNEKQTAIYKSRQKDINQFLTLVNISGVAVAAIWGVLALFMWAYSADINY